MTTDQKIAAATARIKELETLIKLWKTQSKKSCISHIQSEKDKSESPRYIMD